MSFSKIQNDLSNQFGSARIKTDEPLAKHCNWRVGGPADLFFIPKNKEELVFAVKAAQQHQTPLTVLGFGANVLVSDKGIRGLVLLNRAQRIDYLAENIVEADSGTNLAVLAKDCAKNGAGGLEFLIGIPGTVGAAVAVNAGTRTEWISTLVQEALVLNHAGELLWMQPDELQFEYRSSLIKKTGEVVISAKLQGSPDTPANIEQKIADHLKVRKTQPTGPSTGSVFKNPEGDFAGKLIQESGLKSAQIGGAQISEMHANFILNIGGAKATDMKKMIAHVKSVVYKKFGIQLEEEIRYLGEWGTNDKSKMNNE